uniref:putative methyltransferase-like protein 21E isoform X7 n=1 Tax=Callithrix jacchus TaxID=9483 RepID=UPI0023DD101F|nr:putative methyltransferase-like protein 21E isoform X7 [Callithrix jacchus]
MIKKTSIYRQPSFHYLMDSEAQEETREDYDDKQVVTEILARCFIPTVITNISWEIFHFIGHEIRITEAMDCYGAVVWPSALVLCYFLETNAKQYNMVDKNVIEIGAGTGLVSIVASLLGSGSIAISFDHCLLWQIETCAWSTPLRRFLCDHGPLMSAFSLIRVLLHCIWDLPASGSIAWSLIILGETRFHHVGQADLELPTSGDSPPQPPKVLGLQA